MKNRSNQRTQFGRYRLTTVPALLFVLALTATVFAAPAHCTQNDGSEFGSLSNANVFAAAVEPSQIASEIDTTQGPSSLDEMAQQYLLKNPDVKYLGKPEWGGSDVRDAQGNPVPGYVNPAQVRGAGPFGTVYPPTPAASMGWTTESRVVEGMYYSQLSNLGGFSGQANSDLKIAAQQIQAANITAKTVNYPLNVALKAAAEQTAQNIAAGNALGAVAKQQAAAAISSSSQYIINFTAINGDPWNKLRDTIFVPIGILLLLTGAVLSQAKAIASQANPVLGPSNPLDGILRSIVAIFLIPATFLVVNYGIDVSNSITYTLSQQYSSLFGGSMYQDAIAAELRAFPVRGPKQNQNAGSAAASWPTLSVTSQSNLENNLFAGLTATGVDEAMPGAAVAARLMTFGTNAALNSIWNVLGAFRTVYLLYLFLVGPVIAGLWVWPTQQLRSALPNWIEGCLTICFWSLFWNTVILLIACFKGVDGQTGTILMTALNFLATSAVKYAFDFVGLVKAAGQEAAQLALKGSQAKSTTKKDPAKDKKSKDTTTDTTTTNTDTTQTTNTTDLSWTSNLSVTFGGELSSSNASNDGSKSQSTASPDQLAQQMMSLATYLSWSPANVNLQAAMPPMIGAFESKHAGAGSDSKASGHDDAAVHAGRGGGSTIHNGGRDHEGAHHGGSGHHGRAGHHAASNKSGAHDDNSHEHEHGQVDEHSLHSKSAEFHGHKMAHAFAHETLAAAVPSDRAEKAVNAAELVTGVRHNPEQAPLSLPPLAEPLAPEGKLLANHAERGGNLHSQNPEYSHGEFGHTVNSSEHSVLSCTPQALATLEISNSIPVVGLSVGLSSREASQDFATLAVQTQPLDSTVSARTTQDAQLNNAALQPQSTQEALVLNDSTLAMLQTRATIQAQSLDNASIVNMSLDITQSNGTNQTQLPIASLTATDSSLAVQAYATTQSQSLNNSSPANFVQDMQLNGGLQAQQSVGQLASFDFTAATAFTTQAGIQATNAITSHGHEVPQSGPEAVSGQIVQPAPFGHHVAQEVAAHIGAGHIQHGTDALHSAAHAPLHHESGFPHTGPAHNHHEPELALAAHAPVHHQSSFDHAAYAPVHHEAGLGHAAHAPVHHEAGFAQVAHAPVHHESGFAHVAHAPVHHESGFAPAAYAPLHHEAAYTQVAQAPVHYEAAYAQVAHASVHHEAAYAQVAYAQVAHAPVHHEAAYAQVAHAPVHHEAAYAHGAHAPVHHEATYAHGAHASVHHEAAYAQVNEHPVYVAYESPYVQNSHGPSNAHLEHQVSYATDNHRIQHHVANESFNRSADVTHSEGNAVSHHEISGSHTAVHAHYNSIEHRANTHSGHTDVHIYYDYTQHHQQANNLANPNIAGSNEPTDIQRGFLDKLSSVAQSAIPPESSHASSSLNTTIGLWGK